VVIGYLAQDINHALTILLNGIARSNFQGKGLSVNIQNGLKTFAFLSSVVATKSVHIDTNTLILLIQVFRLPWEVINTARVRDTEIQEALTFSSDNNISKNTYNYVLEQQIAMRVNDSKLNTSQRETILNATRTLFPTTGNDEKGFNISVPTKISKPITALIRQLNQMGNLVNVGNHPRANLYRQLVCEHITNQNVLIRGKIHPLNILNAWATYKTGKGMRGSLTWKVNKHIETALIEAVEKSFYTVKGLGISIAHLMDRSGSMTWPGSVTGMPMLSAHQVVTVMVLCFMRAETLLATESKTFIPSQPVGFFGSSYNNNNIVSNTEAGIKSKTFCDMTDSITHNMTFNQAEKVMNKSCAWGCTDIGAGIYHHIARLEIIINKLAQNNMSYKSMSPFELFHEAFIVWTDNDVNSGDQPMIVLEKYRNLVAQLFHLLPYGKDGKQCDPNILIQQYIPKLVVVATQGTHMTIGDPNDPNVLTVSGFDLSFPTILKTFLSH
jgi:hypothetical protein